MKMTRFLTTTILLGLMIPAVLLAGWKKPVTVTDQPPKDGRPVVMVYYSNEALHSPQADEAQQLLRSNSRYNLGLA